jgi:hypothetical protein
MGLCLLSCFLLAEVEDILLVFSWEDGAISGGLCHIFRSKTILVDGTLNPVHIVSDTFLLQENFTSGGTREGGLRNTVTTLFLQF